MEDLNLKPTLSDKVKVDYHGELMENFFSESTIDSGKGLQAIPYKDELVMILFIDKNHQLRLLLQINETDSGWTSYELSKKQMQVSAFDIHHDTHANTLKIAYAQTNNNANELLVSNVIDLNKIEPLKLTTSLSWHQKRLTNTARQINYISMNQSGLLYSMVEANKDATYAYFRYGDEPVAYTLPENTPRAIQLQVGQVFDAFGIFILYDMKGERTMAFQSFPDAEYGEVSMYRYKPSAVISAFSTLSDDEGNNILYLSGDGIFKYTDPYEDKEIICASGSGVEFSKIDLSEQDGEIAIWAIGKKDGGSGLYYCTNRFYESANTINRKKWTKPLMMQEAIDEFSCVKGKDFLNQLFLVGSHNNENSLIHFWQDETTTNWQEHPVTLPNLEAIKKAKTFTLEAQFSAEERMVAFYGEKVTLSAESNMLVYINGKKGAIGPNKKMTVQLDDNALTIVYPTTSISVPVVYVEADFLAKKTAIDPAHRLKTKIKEQFGNKDTLRNAKLPDGSHLIDPSVSDADLDGIAQTTKQAFDHAEHLNNPQTASSQASVARSSSNSSGSALGDIWHSIKKGFSIGYELLVPEKVKEGIKFVIKIAGEAWEWICNKTIEVFRFLERVWEKVKVFFKKVFDFLAFLFNWDDIIDTKRVLKAQLSNIITGVADQIEPIRTKVYTYFDEIKDQIDTVRDQINFQQFNEHSLQQIQKGGVKESKSDPRSNWIKSKKSHLTKGEVQQQAVETLPQAALSTISSAVEKLAKHFQKLGAELAEAFSDIYARLVDLINGRMKLGDFLEYFVLTLAKVGVAVAQEIIDLIFEIVIVLIKGIDKVLNASINIPFFSNLYKKISGGDALSISDLVCLLLAIPTTAIYKVATGEAPFATEESKQGYLNASKNVFQLN